MKPLLFLLLLPCMLMHTGCNRSPTPPQANNQERPLTKKESFNLVWAEVIARTEAINNSATKIIRDENLPPGAPLPPSRIGIKGTPPDNKPGEEPYNLLLEAIIHDETTPFWIHVGNTVPTMQQTYAIATTIDPETNKPVYYPKTRETEIKSILASTELKTSLIKRKIQETQAIIDEENRREALHKPPPQSTPLPRPRVIE